MGRQEWKVTVKHLSGMGVSVYYHSPGDGSMRYEFRRRDGHTLGMYKGLMKAQAFADGLLAGWDLYHMALNAQDLE